MPMGRLHRPLAAWIGDMDLVPHLASVLREGAIDVEVRFGDAGRVRRAKRPQGGDPADGRRASARWSRPRCAIRAGRPGRREIGCFLPPKGARSPRMNFDEATESRPDGGRRSCRGRRFACPKGLHQDLWLPDERLRLAAHGRCAGRERLCRDRGDRRGRSGAPQHLPHPREGGGKGLFRARPHPPAEAGARARRPRNDDRRRRLRRAGRGPGDPARARRSSTW